MRGHTMDVITAERVEFAVAEMIPKHSLKTARFHVVKETAGEMCLKLKAYVYALPKKRIQFAYKWPADWWQAFKEHWFPRWLLRYVPVQYEHVEIDEARYGAVCPHLVAEDQDTHLRWMTEAAEADKPVRRLIRRWS